MELGSVVNQLLQAINFIAYPRSASLLCRE
jgi:hypothetical protein